MTLSIVPNVREPENDESAGELEPIRSALDEQALTLRRQSLSFRSIAVEMECSTSTAYARVRRALRKESGESPEEVRSILSAQLDEVILRMRSILVSREATHGAATRAAEQIVAAAKAKARLVGAEAPARQIIRTELRLCGSPGRGARAARSDPRGDGRGPLSIPDAGGDRAEAAGDKARLWHRLSR